ncbi:hypothetical protein [Nitrosomonas sp. H1_AOB3]|uniref:hypothetical protein n=1 Tax=Nitrosomonas sp. H1_AOB3 TaxID=2741553 RepID=UPI001935876A|nr:hypothetical protein [Nitrosomonas sp. H1_AOB3]QOJ09624.1 MAG: hypothetical protein HRU73_09345 [Nitrosomonas sp. H1_AOB3]
MHGNPLRRHPLAPRKAREGSRDKDGCHAGRTGRSDLIVTDDSDNVTGDSDDRENRSRSNRNRRSRPRNHRSHPSRNERSRWVGIRTLLKHKRISLDEVLRYPLVLVTHMHTGVMNVRSNECCRG